MSTTYAGANAFPVSITIPSDGDGPGIKASDVNAAFEGLADRTVFLSGHVTLKVAEFTASGNWTAPAGVTKAVLVAWGAGGSGQAGNDGDTNGTGVSSSRGGGGGAGALRCVRSVTTVPATIYAVTVGSPLGAGADGGNTIFGALATFRGGRGGAKSTTYAIDFAVSRGGRRCALDGSGLQGAGVDARYNPWPSAGEGGNGGVQVSPATATAGGDAEEYAGGDAGANGTSGGGYAGGGGGGGGGAGPGGAGGAGGAGGNYAAAVDGVAGAAGAANSGAGGGGGGGGAHFATIGGIGAAGAHGAGGSGRLFVIYAAPV